MLYNFCFSVFAVVISITESQSSAFRQESKVFGPLAIPSIFIVEVRAYSMDLGNER